MAKNREIDYGQRLPASWLNQFQEVLGSYVAANFRLAKASSTALKVAAGTDNDQVGVMIDGRWRFITADVNASHPGGVAGTYDVYVTGSDNVFIAGTPETDATVYDFALTIRAAGSPPATALYRKVGTVSWDGTQITAITPSFGDLGSAVVLAPDSLFRNRVTTTSGLTTLISAARAGDSNERATYGESGVSFGPGSGAQDVSFARDAAGPRFTSTVPVNATGFQVAGTALAASHLSNGVTGSGAVALAASPALTGTPTAPTASAGTSTTQLATTAFVVGQGSDSNPLMDGAVAQGVSTRYARQDHVHATDTSRAPLASPTFTGVPAGPTAAVDTSTTQLATTAFVVGQGYLKSAAAASTYAPLASPTFTGVPAGPTAAVDTNTTQFATTAYVIGQGYLKSGAAAGGDLAGTFPNPTIAAGRALGGAGNYGTALPSSGLYNGYVYLLFISGRPFTIVYRADLDATYPWHVVGNDDIVVNAGVSASSSSASFADFGSSYSLPFKGEYRVGFSGYGTVNTNTNAPQSIVRLLVAGSSQAQSNSRPGDGSNNPVTGEVVGTFAASDVVKMQIECGGYTGTQAASVNTLYTYVTPRKIG